MADKRNTGSGKRQWSIFQEFRCRCPWGRNEHGKGNPVLDADRRCNRGCSAERRQLTELGKTIAKYDPYIEDLFTLWILHCGIASNFEQATAWNVFFNKMDLTSAFTRDDMFKMEQELILEETGEEEVSERSSG